MLTNESKTNHSACFNMPASDPNFVWAGITGTVSIDAKGDRNADYSLLNFNRQTNKFDVAGNYLGSEDRYR